MIGADLSGVNLSGADLSDAIIIPGWTLTQEA